MLLTTDIAAVAVLIFAFMILTSPWIAFGAIVGWLAALRISQPVLGALVCLAVAMVSFWAALSGTFIIFGGAADDGGVAAAIMGIAAIAAVILAVPWYLLEAVLIWAHKRSGVSLWSEPSVEPWPVVAKR